MESKIHSVEFISNDNASLSCIRENGEMVLKRRDCKTPAEVKWKKDERSEEEGEKKNRRRPAYKTQKKMQTKFEVEY